MMTGRNQEERLSELLRELGKEGERDEVFWDRFDVGMEGRLLKEAVNRGWVREWAGRVVDFCLTRTRTVYGGIMAGVGVFLLTLVSWPHLVGVGGSYGGGCVEEARAVALMKRLEGVGSHHYEKAALGVDGVAEELVGGGVFRERTKVRYVAGDSVRMGVVGSVIY